MIHATLTRQWTRRGPTIIKFSVVRHISKLIDDRLYFSFDNAETADTSIPPALILSPITSQTGEGTSMILDKDTKPRLPPTMEQLTAPIESRYKDSEESFVGGMGESDAGVWFTATKSRCDPLLYAPLLVDTIRTIKEHRHGVPFGLHTSGLVGIDIISSADGEQLLSLLSSIEVTLGVADPISYDETIIRRGGGGGRSNPKIFGSVCQFIATTAESGFPVEVAVLEGEHQAAASALAIGLGAVQVNVYK